jgi:hypothetical protein
LIFVTVKCRVFFAVRAELLNIILTGCGYRDLSNGSADAAQAMPRCACALTVLQGLKPGNGRYSGKGPEYPALLWPDVRNLPTALWCQRWPLQPTSWCGVILKMLVAQLNKKLSAFLKSKGLFLLVKMAVFLVVAPCSLVNVYQRFRGICCLHHQGGYRGQTNLAAGPRRPPDERNPAHHSSFRSILKIFISLLSITRSSKWFVSLVHFIAHPPLSPQCCNCMIWSCHFAHLTFTLCTQQVTAAVPHILI